MYMHAKYSNMSVAETVKKATRCQQFQTMGAWMDCDGQWIHRVGTTHNLFVGKRCISSVNWWQQLLSRVRCGNLLALQRRTCGGRTRVPAQSVSATFHTLTHATCCQHLHAEAHMPGRTCQGSNAGACCRIPCKCSS
jgi:hypothetical protein